MGMPSAQVGQSINQQQSQGKGSFQQPRPQYQGKGSQANELTSSSTNSATSGQPQMGKPNTYSNTIQPWDNGGNQIQSGKGKGH